MFLKKLFLILLAFFPLNVLAYSNEIYVGGENIGIELKSNGVLIVGTYEVEGHFPANDAGFKTGDLILEIDNQKISSIDDMALAINNSSSDEVRVKFTRSDSLKSTKLKLYKDNSGVFKTGLFVRDKVLGIGTLTFVDPKTKLYGALGHEIIEQSTNKIFDTKDGSIFKSSVKGVIPSSDGNPGEKKAEFDTDSIIGSVKENTTQGIFGRFNNDLANYKLYKVMEKSMVSPGPAKILTVLDGDITSEFDINIIQISDDDSKNKNFIFEIVDKNLLKQTNGIIQGMSGSPIIRDDYVIGAVTHVVVNDPHKGYGIFITNMLEEAEN